MSFEIKIIRKFFLLGVIAATAAAFAGASEVQFIPNTFQVNFEQTFTSVINNKVRNGKGLITYMYPGHLRLEVLEPDSDKSTYVSNLNQSWYYTPPFDSSEKGEVIVNKNSKMFIVRFFDTIRRGLKDNSLYRVKRSRGESYIVDFNKDAEKAVGVRSAVITFAKNAASGLKAEKSVLKNVEWLELTYIDNKKVKLKFLSYKDDLPLSTQNFDFKIPDNTKVVEQ